MEFLISWQLYLESCLNIYMYCRSDLHIHKTYNRGTTQVHNLLVVGDFCQRWSNQCTKLTEMLTANKTIRIINKQVLLNNKSYQKFLRYGETR